MDEMSLHAGAQSLAKGYVGNARSYDPAPTLASDMPLTIRLGETMERQAQILEAAIETLVTAHHRVFGPLPPEPGQTEASTLRAPAPDTAESMLLSAQRRHTDRLSYLVDVARAVASRV